MKNIKVAEFFACAHKLYRLACYRSRGKGRAAPGVAVCFCEYKTVYSQRFIKRCGNIYRILTCHRVNNKQYFVRLYLRLDVLELIHKLLINMQTACRVKNYIIVALISRERNRLFSYAHGVFVALFKNRNPRLFADYLQLFDCRRAVNVTGNQQRAVIFFFEHKREFCRMRCFTGALKAAHKNYCGRMSGIGKA